MLQWERESAFFESEIYYVNDWLDKESRQDMSKTVGIVLREQDELRVALWNCIANFFKSSRRKSWQGFWGRKQRWIGWRGGGWTEGSGKFSNFAIKEVKKGRGQMRVGGRVRYGSWSGSVEERVETRPVFLAGLNIWRWLFWSRHFWHN